MSKGSRGSEISAPRTTDYDCGQDFCELCGDCLACFNCTDTFCAQEALDRDAGVSDE